MFKEYALGLAKSSIIPDTYKKPQVMGWELQRYSVVCTFYILLLTAFRSSKVSIKPETFSWALSIYKKNPEISVVAKVEFPIGKKLFHLVVNPGTSRCPTVPGTGTNYEKRKWHTTFRSEIPTGKTGPPF